MDGKIGGLDAVGDMVWCGLRDFEGTYCIA